MKQNKYIAKLLSITLIFSMLFVPVKAKDIDKIVSEMSLKQKITQTFMMDFTSWNNHHVTTLEDDLAKVISDYDFGGIILFSNNIESIEQTLNLTTDLQKASCKDNGIPLLISTDQEGGSIYRLNYATTLPGNMALGAANDLQYAYYAGHIIGQELSLLGMNTALAPVVDINNNANNPVIGLRSFGDDPLLVSEYGTYFQNGLLATNTISCAKHFPGHGNTSIDSHYGLPVVKRSKSELLKTELVPYQKLIDNQIDMIMSAHILYPEIDNTTIFSNKTQKEEKRPATLSKIILTDLLKDEMNFQGVVCSDALNMSGITSFFDESQAVIEALKAGVDLICMPCSGLSSTSALGRLDQIINDVEKAIENKELEEERLDDACLRILKLKQQRGILDFNYDLLTNQNAKEIVGGKENRSLERQIASKAVTLIENKNNLLPLKLKNDSKVLFLYPYENQKDRMLKGWEKAKQEGLIPDGASISTYQYYRTNYAIIGTLKNAIDEADLIIVNSQVSSDNSMLYTTWTAAGPKTIVDYCKKTNKKSIVMSIDKPYDIQLYDAADAIICVYGDTINITAGIEAILGVNGVSGKLPLDIPNFDHEKGVYDNEIIYPRGYGITYSSLLHPDTPTHLTIEERQEHLLIQWDQVQDASFYQLYRDGNLIYEGKETQYEEVNLENGNLYHYEIASANELGTSEKSNSVSYLYLKAPKFTAYNWINNQVYFKWEHQPQITGYEISYSHDQIEEKLIIMNNQKEHYILKNLEKNTNYSFTVRSFISNQDQIYYSPEINYELTTHTWIWF